MFFSKSSLVLLATLAPITSVLCLPTPGGATTPEKNAVASGSQSSSVDIDAQNKLLDDKLNAHSNSLIAQHNQRNAREKPKPEPLDIPKPIDTTHYTAPFADSPTLGNAPAGSPHKPHSPPRSPTLQRSPTLPQSPKSGVKLMGIHLSFPPPASHGAPLSPEMAEVEQQAKTLIQEVNKMIEENVGVHPSLQSIRGDGVRVSARLPGTKPTTSPGTDFEIDIDAAKVMDKAGNANLQWIEQQLVKNGKQAANHEHQEAWAELWC
ncbi:hypothetical protein CVT24_010280, partial [Panaeolus cyanescens]